MWNLTEDYCDRITRITENIITKAGYSLEKHTVTTEDGYINTMYRIPNSKEKLSNNNDIQNPPVLLSHGLCASSAVFVDQCRLGYYLADEGYDVWLPNYRGTTFSREHQTLDATKDEKEYWDFSWHEIGIYDIPACVDYILENTGFEKVFFVGHSQGATVFNVFASERPEYNEKIALCCLLAPPIIFDESADNYPLKFFVGLLAIMQVLHNFFKLSIHETPCSRIQRIVGNYSEGNRWLHNLYHYLLFIAMGYPNYEQTSWVDFRKLSVASPNSTAIRQLYHFAQIMKNKRFAKYDYGSKKNMELYGFPDPPLYDLSKITSPVALYWSKNDMFVNLKEIERLEQLMGNVVHKHVIESDLFNHMDFLMAKDCIPLVYSHILKLMRKYNFCQQTTILRNKDIEESNK